MKMEFGFFVDYIVSNQGRGKVLGKKVNERVERKGERDIEKGGEREIEKMRERERERNRESKRK